MTQKSRTRKTESSNELHGGMRDATETARQTFEHATNTGRRIQEEAGMWWRNMIGAVDFQRQAETFVQLASNTVPLAKRNMQQLVAFMENSSRASTDVLKKAADAVQAPLTGESQAAWMQFWTATTKATQTNVEGLMEFGTRAMDSWSEFVRNISDMRSESSAR